MITTAWAPSVTVRAISTRCRFIAPVLQNGRTSPALARGRADRSEDAGRCGSLIMWCRCPNLGGRVPRFAHRRVILFFRPVRAFAIVTRTNGVTRLTPGTGFLSQCLAGGGRRLFAVRLQIPLFKRLRCVCVLSMAARPRRELDIAEFLAVPGPRSFRQARP